MGKYFVETPSIYVMFGAVLVFKFKSLLLARQVLYLLSQALKPYAF
jgi:hypothetical protein